jgi:uncharacterized protein YndB with AHSA1/START domain
MHPTPVIITITATVAVPIEKVWQYWTLPQHIKQWNSASPDWHTPAADNDLRPGGKFVYRMEARDESFGFDFSGVYDEVITNERIVYTMDDGRKATILFAAAGDAVTVTEIFEAEAMNPVDMQRMGWQAILDNFKKYTEAN